MNNQVLSVCLANLGSLIFGISVGWLSPSLATLHSAIDTPLTSGPVTVDQIAWLGAIYGIGCILGQLWGAAFSSMWGLKWGIASSAIPSLMVWLLIIFGNYIEYLYLSRLFSGISGAIQYYSVPLFVAEISDPLIRGRLGTLLYLCQCVGILISYIIGSYVNYYIVPYIVLPLPVIFFILFIFIPHTPQHLIAKDDIKNAEKSIRFYKNFNDNSFEISQKIEVEIENMKTLLKNRLTTEKLKLEYFTTSEARYGIIRAIFLLLIYMGNGNTVLITYAATIFRESGSHFDPNISAIIVSAVQIFAVLLATTLIDKLGRKTLMIVSTLGCAVGFTIMGIFSYLSKNGYDMNAIGWIPIVCLTITVISGSSGMIPVTFVLLAEFFPTKIRRVASLIFLICLNILMGLFAALFPIILELFGMYTCFWILGVLAAFGIVYSIFTLHDTTGKILN